MNAVNVKMKQDGGIWEKPMRVQSRSFAAVVHAKSMAAFGGMKLGVSMTWQSVQQDTDGTYYVRVTMRARSRKQIVDMLMFLRESEDRYRASLS